MASKNKKLVDESGKIIGSESDLTNHGFTINNYLDGLIKKYIQTIKNQTDVNEFESLKFNYFKLFPKKMNKKSLLDFTDLVVHDKKTKIFDKELKSIILKEFLEVAIDWLLTKESELNNLIIEALEIGTTNKEIHEMALEKIWQDPIIKECYQIGSTEKVIVEKYKPFLK